MLHQNSRNGLKPTIINFNTNKWPTLWNICTNNKLKIIQMIKENYQDYKSKEVILAWSHIGQTYVTHLDLLKRRLYFVLAVIRHLQRKIYWWNVLISIKSVSGHYKVRRPEWPFWEGQSEWHFGIPSEVEPHKKYKYSTSVFHKQFLPQEI